MHLPHPTPVPIPNGWAQSENCHPLLLPPNPQNYTRTALHCLHRNKKRKLRTPEITLFMVPHHGDSRFPSHIVSNLPRRLGMDGRSREMHLDQGVPYKICFHDRSKTSVKNWGSLAMVFGGDSRFRLDILAELRTRGRLYSQGNDGAFHEAMVP